MRSLHVVGVGVKANREFVGTLILWGSALSAQYQHSVLSAQYSVYAFAQQFQGGLLTTAAAPDPTQVNQTAAPRLSNWFW